MDKQTLLRKLASFLPYRIEVYVFPMDTYSDGWLTKSLVKYPDLQYKTPVTYKEIEHIAAAGYIPILRPFSALTSTILHEGKEVIPAVEVAKLAFNTFEIVIESESEMYGCLEFKTNEGKFWINKSWNVGTHNDSVADNQVAIVDLLRSMHFAVGFESGEYIEKEVHNG